MKKYSYPSVMTIAGFDGSGGAGIQADIKTASALGCYSTSVLTALPVQNTQGVSAIYPIPTVAIKEQIETVLDDIFPQAIKIGMVHTTELVNTIAATLKKYPGTPIVFDPVMVASSGDKLIEEETVAAIIKQLFPISLLITPNMDEAAILAKTKVKTLKDMYTAGEKILKLGCRHLLLKGGHMDGPTITSLYFDDKGRVNTFEFEKFTTRNTHGSGCTLSCAIASYLALGKDLHEAVQLGQTYVHQAISGGIDVRTGKGNGPLNHFFNPKKLVKHEVV
ncbi:bifunctional hydroxymethylpyrimidine kinase/phosphomethylpyrimidine kinase [Pedobacter miscanthi]|uniref:hydroxymethylpyrimidine kinase n=1 Tax=Pedobacter miscanthi TaxID=2259170 RepID=A0A366LDX8_9SPHI|nr:bifunctional hydroxymethylpyrimidine kinase/phosphomethylpyrimidine kinase [Pedobacter miscanthi]RBQ11484.1 bifunctional hydroxymethylpyrimidine kinase/phosphomethylpyrimidine kinase [Pedobacter miscanthi]